MISASCSNALFLSINLIICWFITAHAGNFHQDVDITWVDGVAKVAGDGQLLTLALDRTTGGSAFQSKKQYLFGNFSVQLKLVAGDSASTITSFYLKSVGIGNGSWDEIRFEFYGNLEGDPYILHTKIYGQGQAEKEMIFYLWFDPAEDFHTYTILWNPVQIIFYVDDKAIRKLEAQYSRIIPYPRRQAMRVHGSIVSANESAVREFGLVPIDWRRAPFTAFFRNLEADACVLTDEGDTSCSPNRAAWYNFKPRNNRGAADMVTLQMTYKLYTVCDNIF